MAVISTSSGSGKTTVSRSLAAAYGIPHVELDALHHGPGWEPAADFEERVASLAAQPGWVIDGNYWGRLGDSVVAAADLVVWLDLPLWICLARLSRRTAARILRREELWNGNRETFGNAVLARDGLFRWTIRHHGRRHRTWPARLAGRNVIRLRSPADVAAFSALLAAPTSGPG